MKTTQQFALTFVVLSLLGSRASTAITSTDEMNRAASKKQIPISGSSFSVAAAEEDSADTARAKTSEAIPRPQFSAKAGVDYKGDGLAVIPAPNGARLRCVFQKMEGEVTREGLWLASTVTNAVNDRFRVIAASVGRLVNADTSNPLAPFMPMNLERPPGFGLRQSSGAVEASAACPMRQGTAAVQDAIAFPRTGAVEVSDKLVRFIRPGLTEEYSVSMDGVRQDFIIEQRPVGEGPLRMELTVSGARVEPSAGGAQLVLENSGRKIAYSRLRVTDATGRELTAHMEVSDGRDAFHRVPIVPGGDQGRGGTHPCLVVVVNDAEAVYPVRIDPTLSDANWSSMGGFLGAQGAVNTAVVDGSGNLYIGGQFTVVGDVFATNIAKWNGSSWSALGSGIGGDLNGYAASVNALAVSGSDLYAGGGFTTAAGNAATNIAKWDGSSWSALGSGMVGPLGTYPPVLAVAVSGSDLYAGGNFTTAGGSAASGIAKWDGTSWTALGSGMDDVVFALAVSGSDLYAGGYFRTAGGSAASGIAKWDGSNWTPLGSGIDGGVNALAVSGSDLYAGGYFTTAAGNAATNIAKWDGSSWTALGSGTDYEVRALAVSGSDVYAGGDFTTAGGSAANNIAKWDGTSWTALGSRMRGNNGRGPSVNALAVSGSNLYAGGYFTTAGGSAAYSIAKWNGSSWTALGSGMDNWVLALAASGSDVYAGGYFSAAGGSAANYIAEWNGSSWSALGSGISAPDGPPYYGGVVAALAVSGSDVYAGGRFTTAGGSAANSIAKWDGSSWSALGSGMGGAYPYVNALAVSGSNLYAGGDFTTAGGSAANGIAKWDGSSWSALGSGMNYPAVTALAVSGSDLYAGGFFTFAGGTAATNIARWNGSSWSPLGSGMGGPPPPVLALAVSGSDLYAGGDFTNAGGIAANNIAKWDGSSWSALGSGMNYPFGAVTALAVSGSNVYAGGYFTTAGGSAANGIAKWDGSSWSALGSGMNYPAVTALVVSGSDLFAGGDFLTAGGKVSPYIARAYLLPLPTLSVLRSGIPQGGIIVSWPTADTASFTLEQAGTLAPPASWVTNAASINDDGTNKLVTIPATNSALFFRLRRP